MAVKIGVGMGVQRSNPERDIFLQSPVPTARDRAVTLWHNSSQLAGVLWALKPAWCSIRATRHSPPVLKHPGELSGLGYRLFPPEKLA
jgi:hypothetical protein